MNVNAKFSPAQFTSYVPNSATQVIKGRQGGVPKTAPSADDAGAQNALSSRPVDGSQDPVISDDERQFFENLFPTAAGEIRSYSPYGRGGMAQAAVVGSLVDRKG